MVGRTRKAERTGLYETKEYLLIVRSLARNLRRVREERHLTQQRVADLADLQLALYVAIENERQNVTLVTIAKLCRGLGVLAHELLGPREQKGTLVAPAAAAARTRRAGKRPRSK